jgi:hypothetical protein
MTLHWQIQVALGGLICIVPPSTDYNMLYDPSSSFMLTIAMGTNNNYARIPWFNSGLDTESVMSESCTDACISTAPIELIDRLR